MGARSVFRNFLSAGDVVAVVHPVQVRVYTRATYRVYRYWGGTSQRVYSPYNRDPRVGVSAHTYTHARLPFPRTCKIPTVVRQPRFRTSFQVIANIKSLPLLESTNFTLGLIARYESRLRTTVFHDCRDETRRDFEISAAPSIDGSRHVQKLKKEKEN